MWPFKRRATRFVRRLDHPLLYLSKRDPITIRDACEGVLGTGGTGSGKTVFVGANIAEAYLRAGFGGLVLTLKPDEVPLWQKYWRRTGRKRDFVIFGPGEGFNFLNYELQRPGGGGQTQNIVDLLSIGCEIAQRGNAQGGGGGTEAFFWKDAREQLCRNIVSVLSCGLGEVSVPDLYRFVASLPRTTEQKDSAAWQQSSFCYYCFCEAERNCTPEQADDLELAASYIINEFVTLGEKTQGNIAITLTSMIDVLNRGIAKRMLCGETTIWPQMLEEGRIIVMGTTISEHGLAGRLIQGIVKYSFQRDLLRRNVQRSPRPVFLWADEAQTFVNSFDVSFVATCRSARVANVFFTQNLPGFRAGLGGNEQAKAETDAIFGNLNLKLMQANSDPETNAWGSTLIGRSRRLLTSTSSSTVPGGWPNPLGGWQSGTSASVTEHIDFELEPRQFTVLRRGGRHNLADAIVFQGGRIFNASGRTWMRASFSRRF